MSGSKSSWRLCGAWAALLLLTGCGGAFPHPARAVPSLPTDRQCPLGVGDRQWVEQALANWRVVVRQFLRADRFELPQIVVYDARCSYTLVGAAESSARWIVAEHRGEIPLPNGDRIPPAPNAFNGRTGTGVNFVVMSLPSIWESVAPRSEIPLPWFLEAIFFHELGHSYQAALDPSASFAGLHRDLSLPPSVNDDSVQENFARDPAYVRDYEAERDLLFRAAAAPTEAEARAFACQALARLRSRRQTYFTAANAVWARVDELSLTTEGLGQWLGYAWLTRGRAVDPATALPKMRGAFWSQDEGLAIFLVVDRLVPDWRSRLFARPSETAEALLRRACGR